MFTLPSPPGTKVPLHAMRPEDMVRAFAVARVLGRPLPSQQLIAWIQCTTPEYDQTADYWSPYGYIGEPSPEADMYVLPWARGALAYQSSLWNDYRYAPKRVDPVMWYVGIKDVAEAGGAEGMLLSAFELAADQTDPNGMWGDAVTERLTHVRAAIEKNRLFTDPAVIARKMKRARERMTP